MVISLLAYCCGCYCSLNMLIDLSVKKSSAEFCNALSCSKDTKVDFCSSPIALLPSLDTAPETVCSDKRSGTSQICYSR
ncbi:hypothetical protein SAY87_009953 [Trapa incisa]|uniref:Uncharacterized protein n=1 Tax=Trapa incisa TaxID=236973 RepID=A0AAN7GH26_9MYRT|nr:hypothetical protein SAY87_009953 [Trapa incisa]